MKTRPRILFLEDVAEDFILVNRELRGSGLVFEAKQVETREAFLHELLEHPPDLILSDHGLHSFDAFSALALAKEKTPHTPFIFVIGSLGEEAALRALKSGAADFVLKHRLVELAPAIRRALWLKEDRAQEHETTSERSATDARPEVSYAPPGETALGLRDENYRLLVESAHDYAIYLLDVEGRVASWNQGGELIHGYSGAEIVGQHYSRFFNAEDIQQGKAAWILQTASTQGRCCEEIWRIRKDGSGFWASLVVTALRDEAGRLIGFSEMARDITEIKAAQDQMRRVNGELEQRLTDRTAQLEVAKKELEAFSYSASHDLRAPLRHLDGFVELLKQSLGNKLDPTPREYLSIISESAQQMARLIDALLAFSRIGRAVMRRVPINMSDLARAAARDSHYALEGRDIEWVMGDLPQVLGDPSLLRQVLLNLLSNALKFTRSRPRARIEIGSTSTAEESVFFVRDNGIGFDMQYAGKLFGVFQRLHAASEFEGTGIGLANVRRIIQRHGGRTWAEGVPEQGATFYFSLPKATV